MPARERSVLFVVSDLSAGGAELRLLDIVNGLVKTGWAVAVATLEGGGVLENDFTATGAKLYLYERKKPRDFGQAYNIRKSARECRASVVCALGFAGGIWSRLPFLFVRKISRPAIIARVGGVYAYRTPLQVVSDRVLARITDVWIANSRAGKDSLAKSDGISSEKIIVIPNGFDASRLKNAIDEGARMEGRARLGVGENDFLVAQVGRIHPVKDTSSFLAVAEKCAVLAPGVKFLFVGAPNPKSPDEIAYYKSLEDRIDSLKKTGSLIMTGFCREPMQYVRLADAFLLTSTSESLPSALLEAMAAGLPCVATDVGDVRFLLDNDRSGITVKPGDVDSMLDAIMSLRNDKAAGERLGASARARVLAGFTKDKMVGEYVALFERVIGNRTISTF